MPSGKSDKNSHVAKHCDDERCPPCPTSAVSLPYPGGVLTRFAHSDDNQHMGFTGAGVEPLKKLVDSCDKLSARMDAFEARQHQRKPKEVKPRTKDGMQPSNPHPKEPGG